MASSYSNSLRLDKMAKGDQNGTWGSTFNMNLELLEDAVAGVATVAHNNEANYVVASLNGIQDDARCAVLRVTGALTAARNLVVPSGTKTYIIHNLTTGGFAVTAKTAAGVGVAIGAGQIGQIYIDAQNNAYPVGVSANSGSGSVAAKLTPVDADTFPLNDSAAAGAAKIVTWARIKAVLLDYFDGIFAAVGHTHSWGAITGKPVTTVSTAAPSGGNDGDIWHQV